MPRLTSAAYYLAHKQLRHCWLENMGLYANLNSFEQWQLHDYFQPSRDWTKEQLLAHREEITKKRPALPQQAGRAYVKFQEGAAAWALHLVRSRNQAKVPAGGSRKRGQHNISVRAVVKPEPDLKQLAKALIALAKHDMDQKRAAEQLQQPEKN